LRTIKVHAMAVLICVECGCESRGAEQGWQGHVVDLDDDGEDEVAFFCPGCAEREFGGTTRDDSG
jgi:hypothetical protein